MAYSQQEWTWKKTTPKSKSMTEESKNIERFQHAKRVLEAGAVAEAEAELLDSEKKHEAPSVQRPSVQRPSVQRHRMEASRTFLNMLMRACLPSEANASGQPGQPGQPSQPGDQFMSRDFEHVVEDCIELRKKREKICFARDHGQFLKRLGHKEGKGKKPTLQQRFAAAIRDAQDGWEAEMMEARVQMIAPRHRVPRVVEAEHQALQAEYVQKMKQHAQSFSAIAEIMDAFGSQLHDLYQSWSHLDFLRHFTSELHIPEKTSFVRLVFLYQEALGMVSRDRQPLKSYATGPVAFEALTLRFIDIIQERILAGCPVSEARLWSHLEKLFDEQHAIFVQTQIAMKMKGFNSFEKAAYARALFQSISLAHILTESPDKQLDSLCRLYTALHMLMVFERQDSAAGAAAAQEQEPGLAVSTESADDITQSVFLNLVRTKQEKRNTAKQHRVSYTALETLIQTHQDKGPIAFLNLVAPWILLPPFFTLNDILDAFFLLEEYAGSKHLSQATLRVLQRFHAFLNQLAQRSAAQIDDWLQDAQREYEELRLQSKVSFSSTRSKNKRK